MFRQNSKLSYKLSGLPDDPLRAVMGGGGINLEITGDQLSGEVGKMSYS